MASSVSAEGKMWFLRVCHHVPHELYSKNRENKTKKMMMMMMIKVVMITMINTKIDK